MDQAEQLRRLIKQQEKPKQVARVITVTSGKGGVGKSSISVNLAIQLRKLGKRVIILDADFGLANVEVLLGIRPEYNLADLLYKEKSITEIITKGPLDVGFISGGSGIRELANLTKEQITYLSGKLYELDNYADIIIIDTGAGISDTVLEFVTASSEVLLVTTPEPTSITDSYALLKTLNKKDEFSNENTIVRMVANRVSTNNEGKELFHKLSVVVNRFLDLRLEFLGAVPQDTNVSKAVMSQKPVSLIYPNSVSSKAISDLANILCEHEKNSIPRKGISELFSNLLKRKMKI